MKGEKVVTNLVPYGPEKPRAGMVKNASTNQVCLSIHLFCFACLFVCLSICFVLPVCFSVSLFHTRNYEDLYFHLSSLLLESVWVLLYVSIYSIVAPKEERGWDSNEC